MFDLGDAEIVITDMENALNNNVGLHLRFALRIIYYFKKKINCDHDS